MYDDILGDKKKTKRPTKDSIIKALEYNVKSKQKLIDKLLKKITELERQIEDKNQDTHGSI